MSPSANQGPTALIAEDEPRLARALQRSLGEVWPQLQVVGVAEDGAMAVQMALALRPQLLFLDIQMPGMSGLEVAAAVADEWDDAARNGGGPAPAPLVVFVTAHDQHAVAAFDHAAVDYVLKPVTTERLARCVQRVQLRLLPSAHSQQHAQALGPAPSADRQAAQVQRWQRLQQQQQQRPDRAQSDGSASEADLGPLRSLRLAQGNRVWMVPLAQVVVLEAADKYVRVVCLPGAQPSGVEWLVRLSLRELADRIEGQEFWQVHRSVLVNHQHIRSAQRDEAGHYWLDLAGVPQPIKVSRAFSHLFRPL